MTNFWKKQLTLHNFDTSFVWQNVYNKTNITCSTIMFNLGCSIIGCLPYGKFRIVDQFDISTNRNKMRIINYLRVNNAAI